MATPKKAALPSCSESAKTFKLVFLGEESVGKTAIISRFIHGDFQDVYEPTIGIDIHNKNMSLDGNKTAHLQLWDTAGQERFRSLIPSYIRDCSVGVVIYDITSRDTFVKICNWIHDVRNQRGPYTNTAMVLVGNKTDLHAQRQVTTQEGITMAANHGMLFIETSAKTSDNIRQLFQKIVNVLPGSDDEDEPKRNVSITKITKRRIREGSCDKRRTSMCQNFYLFCNIYHWIPSFCWH